jgi:hypothetical protein
LEQRRSFHSGPRTGLATECIRRPSTANHDRGTPFNSSPLICLISKTSAVFKCAFRSRQEEFGRVVGGMHAPLAVEDVL